MLYNYLYAIRVFNCGKVKYFRKCSPITINNCRTLVNLYSGAPIKQRRKSATNV